MADYAFATDFFGFAQIREGYIAWPRGDAEAEVIAQLSPGDRVVPKFAQAPTTGTTAAAIEAREQVQRTYVEDTEHPDSYEALLEEYGARIRGGDAAVSLILTVTGSLPDAPALGKPWARASVDVVTLDHPFSTQEFLRLRPVPEELARQFKGMVAPGRHIQALPDATVDAIVEAAKTPDREPVLRRYSLVRARTPSEAEGIIGAARGAPSPGDAFYVGSPTAIGPLCRVEDRGRVAAHGRPIELSPDELRALFVDGQARARAADKWFPAGPGLLAADQLAALLEGGESVAPIDNFAHFHDRYVLLDSRITQARTIRDQLPAPESVETAAQGQDEHEGTSEEDELVQLAGLSVTKLRDQLPGIEVSDDVLAEALAHRLMDRLDDEGEAKPRQCDYAATPDLGIARSSPHDPRDQSGHQGRHPSQRQHGEENVIPHPALVVVERV